MARGRTSSGRIRKELSTVAGTLADSPVVAVVLGGLPLGADLLGGAAVHRGWGVHPDPGVPMLVVVGDEEPVAERAGVFR